MYCIVLAELQHVGELSNGVHSFIFTHCWNYSFYFILQLKSLMRENVFCRSVLITKTLPNFYQRADQINTGNQLN